MYSIFIEFYNMENMKPLTIYKLIILRLIKTNNFICVYNELIKFYSWGLQ